MSDPKPVRITSADLARRGGRAELESRRATEEAIAESLREQAIALRSLITGVYDRPRPKQPQKK